MILYEKVMIGKKTTYREYVEPVVVMPEIENNQIVTLLSAPTISMLMSVSEQLPPHATLARRIRGVEESIKALAQLNGDALDPQLIVLGVGCWNAAIHAMQDGLTGVSAQ